MKPPATVGAGGAADAGFAAAYLVAPDDAQAAADALGRLEGFLVAEGYLPLGRYVERGPDDLRTRPARRRLLSRVAAGGPEVICVLSLDDLAGTRQRVLEVLARLRSRGVRVVSAAAEPVDDVASLVQWLAGDADRRRARASATLARKRSRGERVGAIPLGYRLGEDGRHVEPDAREAELAAEVRRLSALGLSGRSVARVLSAAGWTTRRGTPLSHKLVYRLLRRT